jgi:hypothetical protein
LAPSAEAFITISLTSLIPATWLALLAAYFQASFACAIASINSLACKGLFFIVVEYITVLVIKGKD